MYAARHHAHFAPLPHALAAAASSHPCRVRPLSLSAVLSTIDMAKAKGSKGEVLAETIRKAIKQYMPLNQPGLRKDYYSLSKLRR